MTNWRADSDVLRALQWAHFSILITQVSTCFLVHLVCKLIKLANSAWDEGNLSQRHITAFWHHHCFLSRNSSGDIWFVSTSKYYWKHSGMKPGNPPNSCKALWKHNTTVLNCTLVNTAALAFAEIKIQLASDFCFPLETSPPHPSQNNPKYMFQLFIEVCTYVIQASGKKMETRQKLWTELLYQRAACLP